LENRTEDNGPEFGVGDEDDGNQMQDAGQMSQDSFGGANSPARNQGENGEPDYSSLAGLAEEAAQNQPKTKLSSASGLPASTNAEEEKCGTHPED